MTKKKYAKRQPKRTRVSEQEIIYSPFTSKQTRATITKDYINEIKTAGNGALANAIESLKENNTILYFLENLGYLPKDFDGSLLLPFLENKSSQIRFWAVKNLGKIEDVKYLQIISRVAKYDSDSSVRREAVSSIGRMRNPKNIQVLVELLKDPDPKILAQAIRGL